MVTVYRKESGKKRYVKIKNFRRYANAYAFIGEQLIKIDYRLHWAYSTEHLCDGYTSRRVFPFGSTTITRKGIDFKIKI